MGLFQVAERVSLGFFADGANAARTDAALAAAQDLYSQRLLDEHPTPAYRRDEPLGDRRGPAPSPHAPGS